MKREKRKVKECYLLLAGQSVYPSKMKITGVPPQRRRKRSQLNESNRGPPTLELEKKTKDAEKLPTQYRSVGKRKETPGGRSMHAIRREGARALKPTNLFQLRDNDRHD